MMDSTCFVFGKKKKFLEDKAIDWFIHNCIDKKRQNVKMKQNAFGLVFGSTRQGCICFCIDLDQKIHFA